MFIPFQCPNSCRRGETGAPVRASKNINACPLPLSTFIFIYLLFSTQKNILFFILTVAINAGMIVQAAWAVTVSAT